MSDSPKTLVMALEGPQASWCVDGRQRYRQTQPAPEKSAMVGFLACALGLGRDDPQDDLWELGINVETVSTGSLFTDYHTISGAATYDGGSDRVVISHRQYVTDVKYRVEVKGPEALIFKIAEALERPQWQLYLGRRSCPLTRPPLVAVQ